MNKEIVEAFRGIQEDAQKLQNVLIEADFESTQEVFDAALYLYEQVGVFIETVEDADTNLDPETSNLPDIDGLFVGNPVSDYVKEVINFYAESKKGNEEAHRKLFEAAINAEKHQNGLAEEVCSYPNCECGVDGCWDEEEGCEEDCCIECCACDLSEMDLHEFIDYTEEDYAAQVMANMELIEEELKGKTEFSQADLYLIRYYLKRQPYTSDFTVEGLSDRGLELAWKKIQYIRNIR